MEAAVRNLLARAEEDKSELFLQEAFEKLERGRKGSSAQTDPFNSDQYVVCAEVALKLEKPDICDSCIKLFFQKTPPSNQFLCRAYLCQAQLNAPASSSEQTKLEQATGFLLKAINFAKTNKRYHFIVYNASVLYWSMVRPFLKPGFRHLLAKTLHVVVKALDDIGDLDYDWRAHLMIVLIECHVDANSKDDASNVAQAALQFTKMCAQHLAKEVFALQLQFKLVDPMKINSLTKGFPELTIYYRIHKLKSQSNPQSSEQVLSDLSRILNAICEDDDSLSLESKSITSNDNKSSKIVFPLSLKERNGLLLDVSRLCLDFNHPAIGEKALSAIKELHEKNLSTEIEYLKCELQAKKLDSKHEKYSKSNVEARLQIIETLSEHVMTAYRQSDGNLIQVGCVTLWNLCLPFLQINLRNKVRKYVTFMADMLEGIDSSLLLLRCQIHIESAKCEEEQDQLQSAILHLIKASGLDDTGSYKTRIDHAVHKLKLKALLYQIPSKVEDHARMIIEQAESCKDASTAEKMSVYLTKAGSLLAPHTFHLAIEGEKFLQTNKGDQSLERLAERVKRYKKSREKISGHLKHVEGTNDRERVYLWADLVKTARKQNAWKVTRMAARYCLLYDDDRWPTKTNEVSSARTTDSKVSAYTSSNINVNIAMETGEVSKLQLRGMTKFIDNHDLLYLLAEINFLYAESSLSQTGTQEPLSTCSVTILLSSAKLRNAFCSPLTIFGLDDEALVHLLNSENLKLLEVPKLPEDFKLRPKKRTEQPNKDSESADWLLYCNWVKDISIEAIQHFQRAATIGVEINRPWIVSNASVYIWNYTNHLLTEKKFSMLKVYFHPFYDAFRSVGFETNLILFCDMANALAQGYIQDYIPTSKPKSESRSGTSDHRKSKQGNRPSQNKLKTVNAASQQNLDVMMGELKQALEILDYVLSIPSNNENVPTALRYELIRNWVLCKILSNQTFPKSYSVDKDETSARGLISKALCAAELLFIKDRDIIEVTQCPLIQDVISYIRNAQWDDQLVLLQIWSQLAVVAFNSREYQVAIKCCDTAIEVGKNGILPTKKSVGSKKKSKHNHDYSVEQEMLYYASVTKGQCLMIQMNGRTEIRRAAMDCFVQACLWKRWVRDGCPWRICEVYLGQVGFIFT